VLWPAQPLGQVFLQHQVDRGEVRCVHRADVARLGQRIHVPVEVIDDGVDGRLSADVLEGRDLFVAPLGVAHLRMRLILSTQRKRAGETPAPFMQELKQRRAGARPLPYFLPVRQPSA
jgi:hypothetical protein